MTPRIPEREGRLRTSRLLIGAAVAALCVGGGVASAQTGGSEDPSGGPLNDLTDATDNTTTEPGAATEDDAAQPEGDAAQAEGDQGEQADQTAGKASAQRASSLRLTREEVTRKRIYFSGRHVGFRFETGGGNGDLKVSVVKRGSGKAVKRWTRNNVRAGERTKVQWHGERKGGGEAKKGEYFFEVREMGAGKLSRKRAKGSGRSVKLFPAIFPVRGRHQYWDGWGAGRGHRGQDVGAKCGTKMVAARAGKVAYKAYNGGGYGYYVVINDKTKKNAYVYAHLKRKATVSQGSRVKAGQKIGRVGESGNASGCHLHFEYWEGKWGSGGSASPKATKRLKRWDRWS